ncbi:MAG: cation transporter [Candidatus Latescibacteria bacterium]|nr:cation transporter [Candidatus Latescibacterota bacterium]
MTSPDRMTRRFKWSLILTLLFVAGEALAGWWANSLALLSDAGHNLADGAALGLSWYALRISQRAPSQAKTFGYHRAGILAALVNSTSLVVIALAIFYEGAHRLLRPEVAQGEAMVAVASVAVIVNTVIAVWLRRGGMQDVNVRSAVVHMIGDALFSVGVIVAGLVMLATGWLAADPIVSLLIGVFILWSSWGILKETVNILMEGSPLEMDMDALVETMRGVPGVQGVHDLHVWMIASGMPMLSAHVLIEDQALSDGARVITAVNHRLQEQFGIWHTTLQVECLDCTPNGLYCTLQPNHPLVHHHDHDHGK